MDRRNFLKVGAAGVAGLGLGLARPARAVIEPDPCVPGLSYISGDVAGTVPAGETWHVVGDVNLTGDLIVEGTLTGVDTFILEGNGYQILVQSGGRADLAGLPKTGWARRGDPVVGWQTGDRLAVSPTAVGVYLPAETTWGGSWETTVNLSSDVPLPDGTVARPEVVNLDQSIRLRNLSRIMLHGDIGIQRLTNVAVVDSGVTDVLDFYPIHFHLCGESSRGSVLRDVVVENGKHHSFVPHESHGIEFVGCAAVNGTDDSFWWNPGDKTNDLLYDRCAVVGQSGGIVNPGTRNTGFRLANGSGNHAVGCVAAGVRGTMHSAGFLWPENGGAGWTFADAVAHNNNGTGVIHYSPGGPIAGAVAYRNGGWGLAQLTYLNRAVISDILCAENERPEALVAKGTTHDKLNQGLTLGAFHRVNLDKPLRIDFSPSGALEFVEMTDSTVPGVIITGGTHRWRWADCGLAPVDFDITTGPATILSTVEGGVEAHRYENNTWAI